MKIKQSAFAAICADSPGKPYIIPWTVNDTATAVRNTVGRAWCKDDHAAGWRAAKVEGMRVIKIDISADQ